MPQEQNILKGGRNFSAPLKFESSPDEKNPGHASVYQTESMYLILSYTIYFLSIWLSIFINLSSNIIYPFSKRYEIQATETFFQESTAQSCGTVLIAFLWLQIKMGPSSWSDL